MPHTEGISGSTGPAAPLPSLRDIRESCCGCSACYAVCPAEAIAMEVDEEGFLYPVVHSKKCVRCFKCVSVCAFKRDQEAKGLLPGTADIHGKSSSAFYKMGKLAVPVAYAVKHREPDVRMDSSSGGIFTALSNEVLREGGAVYGCVLDDRFLAVHDRAVDDAARNRMRGSKYIQSEMRDSFAKVSADLLAGRRVLFSGTPCQIAGLNSYLGKSYDNLLCIDVVCHGVPSPKVWKDYLKWREEKANSKVTQVVFRNKKDFGWHPASTETVFFANSLRANSHAFFALFMEHCILRLSCFHCPYKDTIHPGNITIGDFWGIEKAMPAFNDGRGVSLVLLNDEKGVDAFERICHAVDFKAARLEDCRQKMSLYGPFHEPKERAVFWEEYKKRPFDYIIRKYSTGLSARVIRTIKKYLA